MRTLKWKTKRTNGRSYQPTFMHNYIQNYKMQTRIIIMLLPALAFGRITVHIKAAAKNESSVTFTGTDRNIISDIEMRSFNITTSNLKDAVRAYSGGSPSDVFVKSPTPWGNLYERFNWKEVTRITNVKRAKITYIATEAVILSKYNCTNQSNRSEIVCDVKADVVNYVKNNFIGKEMSINSEYNIDLVCLHRKLVLRLGVNNFTEDPMNLQINDKITLEPPQSAVYVLNATKVNIDVIVDYESSIIGDVATNFNPRYKGHHFWVYNIRELIGSVGSMSYI
ncbi:spherulin-2A-like [Cydia pomonella]|uniref:spherulin-2A-like n=1 Tax=Cydia pomonella TaxID=82600 RepID=UPI002ADDEF84|nr:spherulin-2A-like [Cydia pomonella]